MQSGTEAGGAIMHVCNEDTDTVAEWSVGMAANVHTGNGAELQHNNSLHILRTRLRRGNTARKGNPSP